MIITELLLLSNTTYLLYGEWLQSLCMAFMESPAKPGRFIQGVEGSYFRSDLYARREPLMQQWADYITGAGAARAVRLNAGR